MRLALCVVLVLVLSACAEREARVRQARAPDHDALDQSTHATFTAQQRKRCESKSTFRGLHSGQVSSTPASPTARIRTSDARVSGGGSYEA